MTPLPFCLHDTCLTPPKDEMLFMPPTPIQAAWLCRPCCGALLLWNPYVTTVLRHSCHLPASQTQIHKAFFTSLPETWVLQLHHLGWTPALFIPSPTSLIIGGPSNPLSPIVQLWQTYPGHYSELAPQDTKFWNLPSVHSTLPLTSWAPVGSGALLLSWLLVSHAQDCPPVWESAPPSRPHYPVKDRIVNHLSFALISTFTLSPILNTFHNLLSPLPWLHIAQDFI